jgi:hypothetical protein
MHLGLQSLSGRPDYQFLRPEETHLRVVIVPTCRRTLVVLAPFVVIVRSPQTQSFQGGDRDKVLKDSIGRANHPLRPALCVNDAPKQDRRHLCDWSPMSLEGKMRKAAGDLLSLTTVNEPGLPRERHDRAGLPNDTDEAGPNAQKERCTTESGLRSMKGHDTIS